MNHTRKVEFSVLTFKKQTRKDFDYPFSFDSYLFSCLQLNKNNITNFMIICIICARTSLCEFHNQFYYLNHQQVLIENDIII